MEVEGMIIAIILAKQWKNICFRGNNVDTVVYRRALMSASWASHKDRMKLYDQYDSV